MPSQQCSEVDKVLGTIEINGEVCPVTNFLDIRGEETSDVNQMVSFVALSESGLWFAGEASPKQIKPLH